MKKFFIFLCLLLLGVILPVVTANAYINYPIKNEYDDFLKFVDDYVSDTGDYTDVYSQALDDLSYLSYKTDVTYPTGTTYQNCNIEITVDEISFTANYVLSGIDTNIAIDFVFYCAIHLYYYDYSTGISSYNTEYVEYNLPRMELNLTPFQLVREGIPLELSQLDFQSAYSISIVNFVSDVTPYTTSANPGIFIISSYYDSNVEDYNSILFRDVFDTQIYSQFSNRLSRLGISPNYSSIDDRIIILTENIRVEIPNYLYTYTLAQNYGGVKVLNPLQEVDLVDWITNAISGFFDFEIVPGMSLSHILMLILSIGIVIMFLKFFAGG